MKSTPRPRRSCSLYQNRMERTSESMPCARRPGRCILACMSFTIREARGVKRLLVDEDIEAGSFSIHISRVAPGNRSHEPHAHEGTEAFYVLAGKASVEVEKERHTLGAEEAIVIDAKKRHGISNAGESELSYMVIISKAR
jgi:quercetin dioxygenase-like cupin family protein